MIQIIKMKLVSPTAKMPMRAHPTDSGWDLFTDHKVCLTNIPQCVRTGVALELPGVGWEAQVRPRSSASLKRQLGIALGTIDSDYRGEIAIIAWTLIPHSIHYLNAGERIAQIVFQKIPDVEIVQADYLNETPRGDKGFGSSDI